jgi:hypothetical protein
MQEDSNWKLLKAHTRIFTKEGTKWNKETESFVWFCMWHNTDTTIAQLTLQYCQVSGTSFCENGYTRTPPISSCN